MPARSAAGEVQGSGVKENLVRDGASAGMVQIPR